jgi:nitrite reductase (NADH) small subunit
VSRTVNGSAANGSAATAPPAAPWRNLGPASLIPLGEGRAFHVDGRRIAVFRARGGRLFAAEAACPHRQGPLADALVGGSIAICPLHGFRFDLATGEPVGNDCRALVTFPVALTSDDEIVVCVESR